MSRPHPAHRARITSGVVSAVALVGISGVMVHDATATQTSTAATVTTTAKATTATTAKPSTQATTSSRGS